MAHTVFTDGVTLTAASWFNDIDTVAYTYFGDGTNLNTPTKVVVTLGQFSTSVKTPTIDVITSGALSIGGTTATTLNLGRAGQTQALLGTVTVAEQLNVSTAARIVIGNGSAGGRIRMQYNDLIGWTASNGTDFLTLALGSTINSQVNRVTIGGGGSGVVLQGVVQAGTPGVNDIPDGRWALWRDTSGGTVKLYTNDGGTIKSVALT